MPLASEPAIHPQSSSSRTTLLSSKQSLLVIVQFQRPRAPEHQGLDSDLRSMRTITAFSSETISFGNVADHVDPGADLQLHVPRRFENVVDVDAGYDLAGGRFGIVVGEEKGPRYTVVVLDAVLAQSLDTESVVRGSGVSPSEESDFGPRREMVQVG
jgi:hypothetical protein